MIYIHIRYTYMYMYVCIYVNSSGCIKLVRQQLGSCWFCVLASSTQAHKGSWLLEAPAAAGVKTTKVHKGQPEWPARIPER